MLLKGTNSYVDVAEADAYFEDRLDVSAWTAATPELKAQALVTATRILDDISWVGTAISEDQSLAFPRNGKYFDPRAGSVIILDPTITPKRIVTSTIELAYHLLNNDGLLDNTGSVLDISVGPISLSRVMAPSTMPRMVKNLIKPLQVNGGSHLWWRAN